MGGLSTREMLAWMVQWDATPADAIDRFHPGLTADDRTRMLNTLRKAARRARDRGDPAPPKLRSPYDTVGAARHREDMDREPDEAPPARAPQPERPERPPAPTPDMDRATFLRAQLENNLFDLAVARDRLDHRAVSVLDARLSAVRLEYDKATELERRVVRVERTPAAICALLEERYEAIALRAELFRRRRALAEAGGAPPVVSDAESEEK